MRRPPHNTAKLPRQLFEELGAAGNGSFVGRNKSAGPAVRKERRRVARIQKKTRNPRSKPPSLNRVSQKQVDARNGSGSDSDEPSSDAAERRGNVAVQPPRYSKSILKAARPNSGKRAKGETPPLRSPSPPPRVRVSQGTKDRLAADDDEIAALERKLGVKGRTKLPKAFEEDGLADLMDSLDSAGGHGDTPLGKRRRGDEGDWLERKRQKAMGNVRKLNSNTFGVDSSVDVSGSEADHIGDSDLANEPSLMDMDETTSSSEELDEDSSLPHKSTARVRENPYVAPVTFSRSATPAKYVPPSLRATGESQSEEMFRLRRKVQGLLNRLSEANLISILGDVEKIYRDHPRQHVSSTLLDLLMSLLCDPTSLQDTFIILHAGFIAAIYKVIGIDFGAQAIQRIYEDFVRHYAFEVARDSQGKRPINLMVLLSELYNFQVIGSNLIYDFIRLLLEDLTETNAELLLKLVRSSGLQLRQDDPSSLRNIVNLLQQVTDRVGEKNLSVRTKFMIETIHNIKNHRTKNGITASAVTSEHTLRMKKILGSLNTRNIKANEPLRIGLRDIRESDKRGKWWLVGASYKDDSRDRTEIGTTLPSPIVIGKEVRTPNSAATDLIDLAREHRMNTDVRRSIFIAIMSATDCNDAYLRLQKLGLKKKQEEEIPKVLFHCSSAEKSYNPFYTLVARRVCSDRKLRMGFQLSVWDLFRRMGEGEDNNKEDDDSDDEHTLGLRNLVNLAKMYGALIVEGALGLGVLKTLNLAYLQSKTRTFLEVLLISIFLRFPHGLDDRTAETPLIEIFLSPKEAPVMARGLQYFLKKIVSITDLADSKHDKEIVKWGCRVAGDALKAIASTTTADQ